MSFPAADHAKRLAKRLRRSLKRALRPALSSGWTPNRHRPFERLSVGNNVTRNMARRSRRVEVLHAFRACDGPDSDACRRESLAMARPVHGDLPSTHPRCAVFSRSLGLNDYPGVFNIELTNAVRAFLNPQTCSLLGRPGGATIGKIDRLRSTCLAMPARIRNIALI
jgi:hypothetical protein